jgi:hypothetical protein
MILQRFLSWREVLAYARTGAPLKEAKAEVLRKGAWKLYTLRSRAHEKWGAWR